MMKARHLAVVLTLAALVLPHTAFAAIKVVLNGQQLPADPPPVERGGRVMLPMRLVFESLQATVRWEAATQTAIGTRTDTTVRMTINSKTAYINDRAVTLDVPPQLINESTYMPVRFPAEAFGAHVGWDQATRTVTITLPLVAPVVPPEPAPVAPMAGGHGAPQVYAPREGQRVGTRTEVSIKATPGVLQVIWTEVCRSDTDEMIRSVPGIRHLPKADGSYHGGIATPRISFGEDVPLRYEVHFRNGPNPGDPETIVNCYPNQ